MFKKSILLLGSALCFAGAVQAQKCATDEFYKESKAKYPQIAIDEAKLERDIQRYLAERMNAANGQNARGTNAAWNEVSGYKYLTADSQLTIPVVVHIAHNYGADYIADTQVYTLLKQINNVYNARNTAALAQVIQPFKEYIGNTRFTFRLATIDPAGKPTTGITRHYSYSANGGDEAAKFDPWPSDRYMNIWTENYIGRGTVGGVVLAYATPPASGANNPYGDGLITRADATSSVTAGLEYTVEHEIGHYFNLPHTWGETEITDQICGDDGVDDTPPQKGHFSTCPLYDTACATGYQKTYIRAGLPNVTVDFPDTVNTQNIMNYASCAVMFTIGQSMRMRAASSSDVARRRNLSSPTNLAATGALNPIPDLAPIADFNPNRVFVCANTTGPNGTVSFTNRSWRDTVTSSAWSFTNGTPATSTAFNPASVTFNTPGWVDVSLTAKSNVGENTITKRAVYAADPNAINATDYYQEFNDGGDADMYPMFNYYDSSNYKWELFNTGFYDQKCIRFKNYEPRTQYAMNTVTQTPAGLYADFYTRAFDLSGSNFTARAVLNFYTSGAYKVTASDKMNDSLEIYYSSTCGTTWVKAGTIAKTAIATRYETNEYVPYGMSDWKLQGITLPLGAKTNKTFFRFRYKPGVDKSNSITFGLGTGNHFYLDRINITSAALGVNNAELNAKGMTLAPNPTNGSATVTIKGGDNSAAQIIVTDIAGKVVYRTEARLKEAATQVEVPAERISVKGMYLVQVVANGATSTQKLVVY